MSDRKENSLASWWLTLCTLKPVSQKVLIILSWEFGMVANNSLHSEPVGLKGGVYDVSQVLKLSLRVMVDTPYG